MKNHTRPQTISSVPELLRQTVKTPKLLLLLALALLASCSEDGDPRPSVRVPVHIYNSSGKDIQVTVTEKDAPEEKRLKWNIMMPPGVGRQVQITRADTYTFKVTEDKELNYTFEIPQDFKEAVLLDFGSRGQFKLKPVFYKEEELSDDEADKIILALIKDKGLQTILITEKAPFHILPVRPDIGLSKSAMLVDENSKRKSVYHQWQLTTLRDGLEWR